MKNILKFFLLCVLTSCSVTYKPEYLIEISGRKYQKDTSGDFFILDQPCISQKLIKEREEKIKLKNEILKEPATNRDGMKLFLLNTEINSQKYKTPDSSRQIILSFKDELDNINYSVNYIHYWDYSNYRVFVPFLTLFNEIHKRNQCINRAFEACSKQNMDGVIISPTLNHYKLITLKK